MKQYIKDGKILPVYRIIIYTEDSQIFNPTEEMLLNDGWVEYIKPEPSEEEKLKNAKERKNEEIIHYDSSDEVNIFYISDMPIWMDKATRAGLKLRFEAEIAIGRTDTTLWHEGYQFPLNLDLAMQMLYAIEIYASECYDNTQRHLANISQLGTVTEVDNYDYRTGYPEKLQF